jgi:hypothetical protein
MAGKMCALVVLALPMIIASEVKDDVLYSDKTRQIYNRSTMTNLIALCEEHGWSDQPDSIGGYQQPSQDIYVYDRGEVMAPELFKVIEHGLRDVVDWIYTETGELKVDLGEFRRASAELLENEMFQDSKENQMPTELQLESISEEMANHYITEKAARHQLPTAGLHTIDWIFIRKYSATSDRDWLAGHRDTNQFSVAVPMNDDTEFENGRFWLVQSGFEAKEGGDEGMDKLVAAEMSQGPKANVDESLEEMEKRKNSSAFYIPKLVTGSAMFYNNRVYHGIAPVTKGTKYSLLFFLDMPPIKEELKDMMFGTADDDARAASMRAEEDVKNCQGNPNDATVAYFHVSKEEVDRYGLADNEEADGLHLAWVHVTDGQNVIDGGFELEQDPKESGKFVALTARYTYIGHTFALISKKGESIDTLKQWHITECFQKCSSSKNFPPNLFPPPDLEATPPEDHEHKPPSDDGDVQFEEESDKEL